MEEIKDKDKIFLEVDQDLRRIGSDEKSYLPPCPFGSKCYRKNPLHLKEYRHSFSQLSKDSPNNNHSQNTPKKCSLPIKKGKSTITNYFKKKVDNTVDETDKCDQDSQDNSVKIKVGNRDNYVVEDSDSSIEHEYINKESSKRKRKNKTNQKENSTKFAKFCTKEKLETDLNDLNKLMPDIDQILSKSDDLKTFNKKLDIPSSSSSDCSQASPKSKIKIKRTTEELNNLFRKTFLVSMPEDFFKFWEFCKEISPYKPEIALNESLGFQLIGPFDILSGKLKESEIQKIEDDEKFLTYWRFFYDTPEFQTFAVISQKRVNELQLGYSSSYHLGYFRDTPTEECPAVVSNDPENSCQITGIGDNIFSAIQAELQKQKSKAKSNKTILEKLKHLELKLKSFANSHDISINDQTKIKQRKKKTNALTFHKFGIVVPVVDDVGYRELPETDENLKKLIKKIVDLKDDDSRRKCKEMSEIHRIVTLINYANDEKDFGMGLEFGIDLFCTGHPFFHRSSDYLLSLAYQLLNRNEFGRIIKAHLKKRSIYNGTTFSIL